MQQIILRLFDICAFRAGPQDLPTSAWLLRAILLVYITVEVIGGLAFNAIQSALAEGLFELAVMAIVLYAALQWQGKSGRFLQTYTALTGVGVIIGILALPLFFAMGSANAAGEPIGNYALIALIFLAWEIGVFAHILRHAFEIHFGYALVACVLFIVVYVQIAQALFIGTS